jgi:hypothetical protein
VIANIFIPKSLSGKQKDLLRKVLEEGKLQ